ncbi:MAG: hypothetical protein HC932_02300 [Thermales bacterium]|nr:hypothetical protein [Thermales bacterium]
MKISSPIRFLLLVFVFVVQFILIIANMNNSFSLNSYTNNLDEEIGVLSIEQSGNFDDIKRTLKDDFIKDNKNEIIFKVKSDELNRLKTEDQIVKEQIEQERKKNSSIFISS